MTASSSTNLPSAAAMAAALEHSLLKPDATAAQIDRLCDEAREWSLAFVCVPPAWIAYTAARLSGGATRIVATIGFPHGNATPEVKAAEATRAVADGAHELDMVIAVGWLKSGWSEAVRDDIRGVVDAAHRRADIAVKVIIETALLSRDEKLAACRLAEEAGADFVKTSTGFSSAGATAADVRLMREAVGGRLGVKAAGGIRDLDAAVAMLEAGASRLGCSSSVAIMQQLAAARP